MEFFFRLNFIPFQIIIAGIFLGWATELLWILFSCFLAHFFFFFWHLQWPANFNKEVYLIQSSPKCWPRSELLKNKKFKSLKDFSELELTCDKYSTYTSRSKEHHAGGDLFGKQHEIVVGQILSSSLTKIVLIPHSSAFSQVAK